MRLPFLRWLWALALGALLLLGGSARADQDEAAAAPVAPRDVVDIAHPEAVKLGGLPGDFRRLEHGWLTLELPASVADRAAGLLRDADALRARLTESFAQPVLGHVLVRIARDPDQMAAVAPEGWPPPPYAAGVAYGPLHLALLALQAPETWEAPDMTELLSHELTHLALYDAVLGRHTPRWFDEGLAIHELGELPWKRWKTLWDADMSHRLLPLADLDRGFPAGGYEVSIAYAESADFVRFLMRDADRARFGSFIERIRAGAGFDRALDDAYGTDVRKLEYEWREDVGHRVSFVPLLTGGEVIGSLMAVLAVVAFVKRRRRAKAKLAEWAREEAEMDALEARARARAARAIEAEDDDMPTGSMPGIPIVEHEGRWYTVH